MEPFCVWVSCKACVETILTTQALPVNAWVWWYNWLLEVWNAGELCTQLSTKPLTTETPCTKKNLLKGKLGHDDLIITQLLCTFSTGHFSLEILLRILVLETVVEGVCAATAEETTKQPLEGWGWRRTSIVGLWTHGEGGVLIGPRMTPESKVWSCVWIVCVCILV